MRRFLLIVLLRGFPVAYVPVNLSQALKIAAFTVAFFSSFFSYSDTLSLRELIDNGVIQTGSTKTEVVDKYCTHSDKNKCDSNYAGYGWFEGSENDFFGYVMSIQLSSAIGYDLDNYTVTAAAIVYSNDELGVYIKKRTVKNTFNGFIFKKN